MNGISWCRNVSCFLLSQSSSVAVSVKLCCRTLTSHDLAHFAKIHFKPPHMVLAGAGGESVSLIEVVFNLVLSQCRNVV